MKLIIALFKKENRIYMKKIILIVVVLFSIQSFSQSITVNTSIYTVDQLVNSVLINSPCVSGTNVASKTGTAFGSTNGIGYFENANPNFPFEKGVVLTTGDVTKVPSPNTTILSDGNASWTGDADLEANLLSQSGITINSINASYIEFDFKPKTPNFDFEFIFASEEYGTSQCDFSDAFAFLLKDLTIGGANKNLAVVPAPALSNTPISVETIRDNLYNTNCPSANASFFGKFNGVGFGPAVNFNGQTVKMIASATGLDITHTYHIKLVIADGGNNVGYDSAIFFNANSFNIGQNVLGLDYSVANNKGICAGSSLPVLSAAGLSSGTTFVWKKGGVAFSPAQTGVTLDLNSVLPLLTSGSQTYGVTYTEPGCVAITDDILVEIYAKISFKATLPNIYTCDIGDPSYDFDLTKNTPIIMAGINSATTPAGILDDLPASTIITYHLTNAAAVANIGALSSPYTILNSENGKTIYVRVSSGTSPCYEIRSFQLQIVPNPYIATVPAATTLCARTLTDLRADFDLTSQISLILGAQSSDYNVISFHTTLPSANSDTNVLETSPTGIIRTSSGTVWVRLQNISNTGCFVTTSFQLIVTPLPKVDILSDAIVCTSYKLPVLTNAGAQYWNGLDGTGIQLFAGNIVNATKNLYTFNKSGSCINQDLFKITVANLPLITPPTSTYCTEYILPALAYGNYYTQSGGGITVGNIKLAPGTVINTVGPNKIYVWFEDTTVTPSCTKETSFVITILPFTPLPDYPNLFGCNPYTLTADSNGGVYYTGTNKGLPIIPSGTVINSTTPIYVYKESGSSPLNCTSEKIFTVYVGISNITIPADVTSCSTYLLPPLVVGEYRTAAAGGGSVVASGTPINSTTTLWFYVTGQSCTDNLSFTITINISPLPLMSDTPPQCDVYYLPAVAHSGKYYTKSLGTGLVRPVGYPITSTQTIYFYDKAPTGPCYVESSFLITVNPSPLVDARPIEVLKCNESYFLDDLKDGEYYAFSGGPSDTNPILPAGYEIKTSTTIYVYAAASLPNTCISEYSIGVTIVNTKVNPIADTFVCDTYTLPAIVGQGDYYTATGGPNGSGIKLVPPYAPITSTATLYVYAEDNNRIACSDEDAFTITIYNTPKVAPILPVVACGSYALPPLILPATKYFASAGGSLVTNVEKFVGDLITSSTTVYAYAEIGTTATKLCYDEEPLVITIKTKPEPVISLLPICVDIDTGVINDSYVSCNYSAPLYSFDWKSEDGTTISTVFDFSTKTPGKYTLIVNDLSVVGCSSDVVPFTVLISSKPAKVSFATSGWFSDNQTITVNAIPYQGYESNFLYAIDNDTPQTSNIFTNVSSGNHEVTVSDANGCGSTPIPIPIKLISSPKSFTPNGDGYNDVWNIAGLQNQDSPIIFIFDRYGKIIKQLAINGDSWDGTFRGQPLPADDYWFMISYLENGVAKEYRSHFSLIR
jgi:gliding motility-associated-like protein